MRERARHPGLRRAGLALLWLVCVGGAFAAGVLAQRQGLPGALVRLIRPEATPTPAYAVGQETAPVLEINLSDSDWERLKSNRDSILESGKVLITAPTEMLSATVRLDYGATLTATVRLKGTQVTHLRDPRKWSLRIDLAGEDTLLGMQHWTIHHPKERNYLDEWYYLRALRQEGLPALHYDFLRVILHGQDLGMYAVEELPERALLERAGRAAGPLLRFDQTALLNEWVAFGDALKQGAGTGAGTLAAAAVQPFYPEELLSGSELERSTYIRAASLLDAFRGGQARASQTFDVALMARFLALTDLFGSWHGLNWNNLRFHYNPESARLEPVGYDTNAGDDISAVGLAGQGITRFEFDESRQLLERLFSDDALARAYVAELTRLSDPAWLQAFLAAQDADMRRYYELLYPEFPTADYGVAAFERNAEYIRKVLQPDTPGVQAWFRSYQGAGGSEGGGTVTLMLGNLQRLPVEPIAVTFQGVALKPVPTFAAVLLPARRDAVQFTPYVCYWPQGEPWSADVAEQLVVTWRLMGAGTGASQAVPVRPWPYAPEEPYQVGALYGLPFVRVDQASRTIALLPGTWTLTQTLRIPADYQLVAGPGTVLDVVADAGIVSLGPVRLLGDHEAPVILRGNGGGLAIVEPRETSRLQYVLFDRLHGAQLGDAELAGALTLVGASAELSDCEFIDTAADSALYLFASDASVARMNVSGANSPQRSPAGSGVSVVASALKGGDLSASRVSGAALSARDGSAVDLDGLQASRCGIGVASASGSVVDLHQVALIQCAERQVVTSDATLSLEGVIQH